MPNNPSIHARIADESLRLEKLDDAVKSIAPCLVLIRKTQQQQQV